MGSIERIRRGGDRGGGGAAGVQRHDAATGATGGTGVTAATGDREDVSFAGQPVDYEESAFTFEQSWEMISPSMQEWVRHRVGPAIHDPHTGVPTVYAYCRVTPGERVPLDGATGATYELLAFGKRGLVVSDGTTAQLVPQPGATRWRHRRFDLPVDPTGVRNDHRRAAPANTAAGDGGWVGPAGGALPLGTGGGLLPSDLAELFGNLPLTTQRFLLEPFTRSGRPPVQARVHPAVLGRGAECREVFWVGLFNAGWLAFACAERSIVRRGGASAPDLWLDAADVEALRRAPWDVAAWVAPVDKAAGTAPGPAGGLGPAGGFGPASGFGGPVV